MPEQDIRPQGCIHMNLIKQADTMYRTFQAFKAGYRYFRCVACNAILMAKPIEIVVTHGDEGKECGC